MPDECEGFKELQMKPRILFNQVTIVGLGLIGGSLGMAIRKRHLARRVIGFARHEATIREAKAKGAIDDGDIEFCPDWLGSSDLVVIATPPLTVAPLARKIARLTRHSFILTDVASTKGEIVRAVECVLPSRIHFVGSHPMAGSERSGVSAADARLFQGAPCVVTPTPRSNRQAVRRVSELWRSVGGQPISLSPVRHDALVAQISHLPHLIAVSLVFTAEADALKLAAGGFADTTRIALSDPALWQEISLTNRREMTKVVDRFIRQLRGVRQLVAQKKAKSLSAHFRSAQRKRRTLLKKTVRESEGSI